MTELSADGLKVLNLHMKNRVSQPMTIPRHVAPIAGTVCNIHPPPHLRAAAFYSLLFGVRDYFDLVLFSEEIFDLNANVHEVRLGHLCYRENVHRYSRVRGEGKRRDVVFTNCSI